MPASFGGVVKQLRSKEQSLSSELARVRRAIDALTSIDGRRNRPKSTGGGGSRGKGRRRRMSAEARAKISAAQKRRWAKQKAKQSQR